MPELQTDRPLLVRPLTGDISAPGPILPPNTTAGDPLDILSRIGTKLYSLWVRNTYPFASVGHNLSIHSTVVLNRCVAPRIRLGNSLMIRKDVWLNIFPEANEGLKIVIDDDCLIGARSIISAKNHIHIERDVILATSVLIMDHNHAYEDVAIPIRAQGVTPGGTIRIEQGCWIGQGAAIVCAQGDLVIGRNSVVAANALVTKSFPPYSVIVGNPARLTRQFDIESGTWIGGGGRMTAGELGRQEMSAPGAAPPATLSARRG